MLAGWISERSRGSITIRPPSISSLIVLSAKYHVEFRSKLTRMEASAGCDILAIRGWVIQWGVGSLVALDLVRRRKGNHKVLPLSRQE